MDTLQIEGNWNLIKGKLKKQYGSLTENDLLYVEGQEDELIGRLQRALGKTREEIVDAINSATRTSSAARSDDRTTTPTNPARGAGFEDDEEATDSNERRDPVSHDR